MIAASSSAVTPAVITASASVLAAASVFVANLIIQSRNERRQTALARVNAQLRDLYGPLIAMVSANENLWQAMRKSILPSRDQRRSGALTAEHAEEWRYWLQQALMPANIKMRDVILQHADLMIGDDLPQVMQEFCSHVAAYEVLLARGAEQNWSFKRSLIPHPGPSFAEYIQTSFATLKARQAALSKGDRPAH